MARDGKSRFLLDYAKDLCQLLVSVVTVAFSASYWLAVPTFVQGLVSCLSLCGPITRLEKKNKAIAIAAMTSFALAGTALLFIPKVGRSETMPQLASNRLEVPSVSRVTSVGRPPILESHISSERADSSRVPPTRLRGTFSLVQLN